LADFLKLVQNENMKIYRRVRAWIMMAIILVLPLGITIGAMALDDSPNMWFYSYLEAEVAGSFITIFAVVIAADCVAGEFSSGTIKLLLIRPWSRSKILLSKYIAVVLFTIFFMAATLVFTLLVNGVLLGSDGEYSYPNQGSRSHFVWLASYYGLNLIDMIVTVTMAFMISTVFRSGSLAIGLSIFLLMGGSMLSALLSLLDKPWVDYVLFMNFGLAEYVSGSTPIPDRPFGFSLGVLAGYYALFLALSWYVFHRRDVAA
jgi:ABC-2 type transport system permease protein